MQAAALLSEADVLRFPEGPTTSLSIQEAESPTWVKEFADRLNELLELPADWDSYGALPVRVEAAKGAFELLVEHLSDPSTPAPQVVPTCHGGVQVEWHQAGIDLELEIMSASRVGVFFEDVKTGEVVEADFMRDLDQIRSWIRLLSR